MSFWEKKFYRKGGICQRKNWKKGLKREKIAVEGRILTRKYFSKIESYREDFWQKRVQQTMCHDRGQITFIGRCWEYGGNIVYGYKLRP
jgi:hypothetical protein